MMNEKEYNECVNRVVEQIKWLYKLGVSSGMSYDDCGELAEELLSEDEYLDCTEYSNGKFISEIYQSV